MTGIRNNTARQFNVSVFDKKTKSIRKIFIAPGLSEIDDKVWETVKEDPYVITLLKSRYIELGPTVEDELMENGPNTQVKTSTKPLPKVRKEA